MVLQQVRLQRMAERRTRKSWQCGLAAHTTQCLLLDNTRTSILFTFKELQRKDECAHTHLSTIYACCQDGMTGTSPTGRSDGTRGQKPAYREANTCQLNQKLHLDTSVKAHSAQHMANIMSIILVTAFVSPFQGQQMWYQAWHFAVARKSNKQSQKETTN